MNFNLGLIPLLPFLGATAAAAVRPQVGARHRVHSSPRCAVGAACMVSMYAFFARAARRGGRRALHGQRRRPGSPGRRLHLDLAFRMDALSGVMCLVITFIGFLIHVYSTGYMARRARLRPLLRAT